MNQLAELIVHPSQIVSSPHLAENDPLKLSALELMEDFEAVTNGMPRPNTRKTLPAVESDRDNPLLPWKLLTEAAAAFYSGDIQAMTEYSESIPVGTAPSVLKNLFMELGGLPVNPGKPDPFGKLLYRRRQLLEDGLDLLDEAASYPDLFRRETMKIIPDMFRENPDGALRLFAWCMEVLVDDEPITEFDEISAPCLGAGEASRICALASLRMDPDRALLSWLRSLSAAADEAGLSAPWIRVRLGIAAEIWDLAGDLITPEVWSGARTILASCYSKLKLIIDDLPLLPDTGSDLRLWLADAGVFRNNSPVTTGRKPDRRRVITRELLLFTEGEI